MWRLTTVLLTAGLALASQAVFSVHDDLLAYPQYEVVFSDSYISEHEAIHLLLKQRSGIGLDGFESNAAVQSHRQFDHGTDHDRPDSTKQIHESMWLNGERYICSIPIVETPPRNETSEAEARAEEQKELARATDRGWELLQDLEGNCLYFISGWWSYSFCYNSEVTQYHQLPPNPANPYPPQRDESTDAYVLGRAHPEIHGNEDEWGKDIEVHKGKKLGPPTTELQAKGDVRYLVQRMEGGTTCDLTGKPRRIEIQYHCSPHTADKIGYIKEITTCAYLMVVYTPRLCNDVAFMPPKENKSNIIACRQIVGDDAIEEWKEKKAAQAELELKSSKSESAPLVIGGTVVGGGKYVGKDGQRLAMPKNWNPMVQNPVRELIASSKGKSEQSEIITDQELEKLDIEPEVVERLIQELEKIAGDKGWKLEVIDVPGGDAREIVGTVDDEDNEDDEDYDSDEYEGSQEQYKDEL